MHADTSGVKGSSRSALPGDTLLVEPLLPPKQHPHTQSRSVLLAAAFAVLLSRYCIATFLSAFFSPLADKWGIEPSFNGAIFASYPFGMAVVSVFAPQLIAVLGTRTAVMLGMLGGACMTAAFGVAPDVVDSLVAAGTISSTSASRWLGSLFFVTYLANGTIGALAETAVIILLTQRFKDRLGAVMASVGSVCAVGCMVGPLIGGLLYDAAEGFGAAWQFRAPFFACALGGALVAAPLGVVIPQEHILDDDKSAGSSHAVVAILSPSVVLNLLAVAISGTAVATLDPTLPYRLSAAPLGLSATAVSLFFFFSSLVYVVVSVPIGWLVDRYADRPAGFKAITGSGFVVLALSFALLAPLQAPSPPLDALNAPLNSLACAAVAMALKGVGSALSGNAVYPDLVVGFDANDAVAHATLSALWNAAYAIGWAVGPLAGGLLYDAFATVRLCTGADALAGCASSASSGANSASLPPSSPSGAGAACSCTWQPANGFDGFALVTSLACLASGVACFAAAACSLPGGYRKDRAPAPKPPQASTVVPLEAWGHPLPKGDGVSSQPAVSLSVSQNASEANLAALLALGDLHTRGPWAPRPNAGRAARAQLSKAPSHRSLDRLSPTLATSVDAALDAVGFGWFHAFALPVLCLASMAQSLQTNLLSYTQVCAALAFDVPAEEASVLSSIVFLATLPSAVAFGLFADSHGRRPATIASLLVMVLANAGSAFAPSFGVLVAFQALAGVGLGGTMVPFDLVSSRLSASASARIERRARPPGVPVRLAWHHAPSSALTLVCARACVAAGRAVSAERARRDAQRIQLDVVGWHVACRRAGFAQRLGRQGRLACPHQWRDCAAPTHGNALAVADRVAALVHAAWASI